MIEGCLGVKLCATRLATRVQVANLPSYPSFNHNARFFKKSERSEVTSQDEPRPFISTRQDGGTLPCLRLEPNAREDGGVDPKREAGPVDG